MERRLVYSISVHCFGASHATITYPSGKGSEKVFLAISTNVQASDMLFEEIEDGFFFSENWSAGN